MSRIQTFIFFIILYICVAGIYIFIYHKKKRKKLALVFAVISMIFVTSGFAFIIPFNEYRVVEHEKISKFKIKEIKNIDYIVCDDGTKYEYTAMNSQLTKDSVLYRNDERHSNEKVDITYRYNYKIWGLIPSYSMGYETEIYVNAEDYYDTFCVALPKKKY